MRIKYAALILLILIPTSLFAQSDSWREGDRSRSRDRYRDAPPANAFELTPFVGYRWGGTIFADQTFVFGQDVDVASSANFGLNLGIPIGDSGMKLELMADRQNSHLETQGDIFQPENRVADIDVTYMHAGLQIPFSQSRNATGFAVVSGGVANIDPKILGVSAENRFSASAGLGVKLPVNRNMAFRLEGRGFYTPLEKDSGCTVCDYFYNQDFWQGEVNLGLTFGF